MVVDKWHNVKIIELLDKDDLNSVINLYNELKNDIEYCHQDYALFDVEKSRPHTDQMLLCEGIQTLNFEMAEEGMKQHSHYFLKYVPYSFARVHQDNKRVVTKTIITFLETSDDLVGGDTLIYDRHYDLPTPNNSVVRQSGSSHRHDIVPVILPVKSGDSLIYNYNISHGVSQVLQGHRIVLVSWYVKNS